MDITFRTTKLKKASNTKRTAQKEWGTRRGELVKQRLDELRAADTLEIMRFIPGAHCHELAQNRKGQLSVDAEHPYRVIFEPANNPTPQKEDGGLDWNRVTAIRILEVVDYHGR